MHYFIWFSDPGHAWLQVDRDLIDLLDYNDISSHSYHDDQWLYLEEDRDAPLFINYLDIKGIGYAFDELVLSEDCHIRNLTRY